MKTFYLVTVAAVALSACANLANTNCRALYDVDGTTLLPNECAPAKMGAQERDPSTGSDWSRDTATPASEPENRDSRQSGPEPTPQPDTKPEEPSDDTPEEPSDDTSEGGKGNASANNGKGGNYDRTGHSDNGKGKGRDKGRKP